uniref:3CxxC-type domain-containing protein n=1 Tax=Spermophilus dauricus TaxID=99837 RepID=A0A8C9P5X5_SPEDA
MVVTWRQVFQMLIQEVKPWHKWTLTADKGLLPNVLQPGWMQYQLWTFARFQCSSCSRSWASAHVQVLFHMHWSEKKHRGQVKMRVFAQRCKKCPQPPFEVPEFTQENISRVLNNLVIRILKKCYREGFKIVEEIPAIKDICLQGPHDSKNCEACLQGSCAQSGLGLAKESPVPTPSKDAGEPRLTAEWSPGINPTSCPLWEVPSRGGGASPGQSRHGEPLTKLSICLFRRTWNSGLAHCEVEPEHHDQAKAVNGQLKVAQSPVQSQLMLTSSLWTSQGSELLGVFPKAHPQVHPERAG